MERSGVLKVGGFNASAALSASITEKPSSSKPARRNRLIFGSSSMRRARLLGLFICYGRQVGSFDESAGQGNGNRCSQTSPAARDVAGSTACLDKGGRAPHTEAGSRDGRL